MLVPRVLFIRAATRCRAGVPKLREVRRDQHASDAMGLRREPADEVSELSHRNPFKA